MIGSYLEKWRNPINKLGHRYIKTLKGRPGPSGGNKNVNILRVFGIETYKLSKIV